MSNKATGQWKLQASGKVLAACGQRLLLTFKSKVSIKSTRQHSNKRWRSPERRLCATLPRVNGEEKTGRKTTSNPFIIILIELLLLL